MTVDTMARLYELKNIVGVKDATGDLDRVNQTLEKMGKDFIQLTGAEHRARIDLPNGFEYKIAEMGSASTTTTAGKIALTNNKDSYAQFAELHLNNSGVVR